MHAAFAPSTAAAVAAMAAAIAREDTDGAWLQLKGVGKRFGAMTALDQVSLDIRAGEIHCLLGENGAGKSTLCNLVFGVHAPDSGTMLLDGARYRPKGPADALTRGIAMVHQHFSLVEDLTVADNLLLGQARGLLRRRAAAERIRALVAQYGLELDPDAAIADLSVGERQRVEIVKCLMREPRLLVLDEPTAVLLPDEIAALLAVCRRVADSGCSVVLVTHKLAEIRQVADRVTVLRAGRTVATSTAPAEDIDRLVAAMIARDGAAPPQGQRQQAPRPPRLPSNDLRDEVLQVDGLTVTDAHGALRLDNFTLVVNRGEIVGIAGVEGNGQTELAGALSGMIRPSAGRFFVGGRALNGSTPQDITRAGVGIVPEDRHAVGCVTGLSVAENIFLNQLHRFTRRGLLDRAAMRRAARELMRRFDVRAASEDVAFGGLSGGNQQKAVLARELTQDGLALLVAAQPTRGLDVGAVGAVYDHIRAARDAGVAVLLISSELDELLAVADRIVVLYRGRIMGTCPAGADQRERIGAMMAGQAHG
ncbi:ABC transporter ATP-binding protein [Noviherbaspirillum suwonense]|uniref:Nucleoside ABC transporter ATP-binding protein n=1 Tax=Noviherbaspirillum suwonense TaxID=1224511 RepID=A0ABY1QDC0_9BURK|nr:nucleoside ABC transporter ATP-binding protein [Noviherbaspirillum suwonense]